MMIESFPHPAAARRFYLVMGFLIVLAWGLLAAWQGSAYAELLGHEQLADHHLPLGWHMAGFLLSWFLMTVAMMLPGSLPMLIHFAHPVWNWAQNTRLVGLIIPGYLAPWILFGLLAFVGDSVLHEITEPAAPLAAFSNFIAPVIVLTAGLYQLTPLKRSYMARCRPSQALMLQCDEKIRTAGVLMQGLRLGLFCVGSCWPLMLLMFALGHQQLAWMLALGGILAAERLAPWGPRLAWWVGIVLVVWAAVWVFTF